MILWHAWLLWLILAEIGFGTAARDACFSPAKPLHIADSLSSCTDEHGGSRKRKAGPSSSPPRAILTPSTEVMALKTRSSSAASYKYIPVQPTQHGAGGDFPPESPSALPSRYKAGSHQCIAEASPSPRCFECTYPVLPQNPGPATSAKWKTRACRGADSTWITAGGSHRRAEQLFFPREPACCHACTSPGPSLSSLGGSEVPSKSPFLTLRTLRNQAKAPDLHSWAESGKRLISFEQLVSLPSVL